MPAVSPPAVQGQARSGVPLMLPVAESGVSWAVYDSTAKPIVAQILPLSPTDLFLRNTYYAYNASGAVRWLAFQADLPPGGE